MTNNQLDDLQQMVRQLRAELTKQQDDFAQFQQRASRDNAAIDRQLRHFLREEIEARIVQDLPQLLTQAHPRFGAFFAALESVEGFDVSDMIALLRGDDDVSSAKIEQMMSAAKSAMHEAIEEQIIAYFRRQALSPF